MKERNEKEGILVWLATVIFFFIIATLIALIIS